MVDDWNDKAKKASSRVVAASTSHEDVPIVCEPSPSAPACVCGSPSVAKAVEWKAGRRCVGVWGRPSPVGPP